MKKILLLLVAMLATTTVWAEDYITDVMVIGGNKTETDNLKASYTAQGWTVIDQDLNAGAGSGSDYIFLLYKTASETATGATFITNFWISNESGTAPDVTSLFQREYYLVPFDGSDYFKGTKGDLNSHCGSSSATIHLYYTKEYDISDEDFCTVKSIAFNDTQSGAVGVNGGTTGYDLNTGCGSGSDYIYMHADKSQGWIIQKNVTGDQCYIKGFDAPKANFTSIRIPYSIEGALVIGATSAVFAGFSNLETLTFNNNAQFNEMPIMQGCSKLKHINTTVNYDQTPNAMQTIPSNAFAGTAIENIFFPGVTTIESNAFAGCNYLTNIYLTNTSNILIENYAFSYINSSCNVVVQNSLSDWSPTMYMFSPNLVISDKFKWWYCGWCGGTDDNSKNYLYWTVDNHAKQFTISSYGDGWETYPDKQIITTHNWEGIDANGDLFATTFTLNHVYAIGEREFEGLGSQSHNPVVNVYVDATLHSIGKEAFYDCTYLTDFWFDGNQAQWDAVTKDSQWKNGANNFTEHWHCMVIFNNNGHGSTPDPKTIQWSNLDKVDEPEPLVADGYNFKGWFTDAACTNQWNFNNAVPGDMTLYAGWEEIVVNVPGDVNCDGAVTTADVTCIYNYLLNGDETFIATSDVDGDGFITTVDITAIYNILLNE